MPAWFVTTTTWMPDSFNTTNRVDRPRKERNLVDPAEVSNLFDHRAVTIQECRRFQHVNSTCLITASAARLASTPVMQRWSIGHSRSMHGRHQTGHDSIS